MVEAAAGACLCSNLLITFKIQNTSGNKTNVKLKHLLIFLLNVFCLLCPGFEARRALDIYEPPGGYGCGWWQAVAW